MRSDRTRISPRMSQRIWPGPGVDRLECLLSGHFARSSHCASRTAESEHGKSTGDNVAHPVTQAFTCVASGTVVVDVCALTVHSSTLRAPVYDWASAGDDFRASRRSRRRRRGRRRRRRRLRRHDDCLELIHLWVNTRSCERAHTHTRSHTCVWQ